MYSQQCAYTFEQYIMYSNNKRFHYHIIIIIIINFYYTIHYNNNIVYTDVLKRILFSSLLHIGSHVGSLRLHYYSVFVLGTTQGKRERRVDRKRRPRLAVRLHWPFWTRPGLVRQCLLYYRVAKQYGIQRNLYSHFIRIFGVSIYTINIFYLYDFIYTYIYIYAYSVYTQYT